MESVNSCSINMYTHQRYLDFPDECAACVSRATDSCVARTLSRLC